MLSRNRAALSADTDLAIIVETYIGDRIRQSYYAVRKLFRKSASEFLCTPNESVGGRVERVPLQTPCPIDQLFREALDT